MNSQPAAIALFQHPFYFLRHGQSQLNAQKRIAGSIDSQLTPLGHDQARRAAAILARQPISAIYASPLQRALRTAQYSAAVLQMPVTLIDDITERCWGALEGRSRAERVAGTLPEGAETFDAFAARVLAGLARIDAKVPLVVAHSGVYRVICRTLDFSEVDAPVANALPLLLEPAAHGWRMTTLA